MKDKEYNGMRKMKENENDQPYFREGGNISPSSHQDNYLPKK